MSSTPLPVPHAAPVESRERLLLLDVLRGFALGGVFVSNAYVHFSGRELVPRARAEALTASRTDSVADFLFDQLISGKAMAMFSFLFGLGFALQMSRVETRGDSIVRVYVRRLLVLFLIGMVHRFALWYGDVLSMYALAGVLLLLFRKLPDKTLLVWGLVLILGAPLVVTAVIRLVPLLASSQDVVREAAQENMARMARLRNQTLEAFQSGSWLTTARANTVFYLEAFLKPMQVSHLLVTLGRFLLGFVAGRRLLFHDVEKNRPFFRRLLGWGLGVAVVGSGAGMLMRHLMKTGAHSPSLRLLWQVLHSSIWEMGVLGLAAVYVAGLSLLFLRPRGRRGLLVLAPAGQMALTNYLSQTLISQLVFYGYGLNLIGRLRATSCLAIMFGLFAVQVLVSHLWMARFRFGPMEWVWRSLTYGKRQPLRRGLVPEQRDATPAA